MKLSKMLCAVALLVSIGASAADMKNLRIGVEGAYPPFSEKTAEGELVGFDIDIANALCAVIEAKCELIEQDWDGIIPALLANKFDMIVASMSINEERRKKVDFTKKYYNIPAKFVAQKDAGFEGTKEGMAGKSIGVQRGTIHHDFAEATFTDSDLKLYASQDEANLDLVNGRLDAVMASSVSLSDGFLIREQGQCCEFFGPDYDNPKYHGEGTGIAVRKGDDELREALNSAIKTIRDNGTYNEIMVKYFDFDIYGS